MEFNSMLNKARDLAGPASETISKLLDEFNAALPVMQALGFSVEDIQVTMGLLPEISAKLTAEAAKIDVKALDEMMKKSEQKTLVAVLKALQTAYNIRDQLGDLGLKGIEIDVTLGIPPKISIGFVKSKAAATPPAVVTASA
jgi:predicted regulator of amino acid metabolism with ACT domain